MSRTLNIIVSTCNSACLKLNSQSAFITRRMSFIQYQATVTLSLGSSTCSLSLSFLFKYISVMDSFEKYNCRLQSFVRNWMWETLARNLKARKWDVAKVKKRILGKKSYIEEQRGGRKAEREQISKERIETKKTKDEREGKKEKER